jgi:hypothetical protein
MSSQGRYACYLAHVSVNGEHAFKCDSNGRHYELNYNVENEELYEQLKEHVQVSLDELIDEMVHEML